MGQPVLKKRPPSLSQEGERGRRAEKSILDFAVMGWFIREASCFARSLEQAMFPFSGPARLSKVFVTISA